MPMPPIIISPCIVLHPYRFYDPLAIVLFVLAALLAAGVVAGRWRPLGRRALSIGAGVLAGWSALFGVYLVLYARYAEANTGLGCPHGTLPPDYQTRPYFTGIVFDHEVIAIVTALLDAVALTLVLTALATSRRAAQPGFDGVR